jgi:hypothetical protein
MMNEVAAELRRWADWPEYPGTNETLRAAANLIEARGREIERMTLEISLAGPTYTGRQWKAKLEAAQEALKEMVRWYGKRGGDADELLPADDQQPEIAKAMAVLNGAGAQEMVGGAGFEPATPRV